MHTSTFEAWPRANAVALVGSLVLGVCTALVGSLWALHTYLALTNQTTWELLRRCAHRLSHPRASMPLHLRPHLVAMHGAGSLTSADSAFVMGTCTATTSAI